VFITRLAVAYTGSLLITVRFIIATETLEIKWLKHNKCGKCLLQLVGFRIFYVYINSLELKELDEVVEDGKYNDCEDIT
jgi:hypothetical protein